MDPLEQRVAELEAILRGLMYSDRVVFEKNLQLLDGRNIQAGLTTGTKIGTSALQKLGFFNATPVVQQTKAAHNNWADPEDAASALVNLGLFDQN